MNGVVARCVAHSTRRSLHTTAGNQFLFKKYVFPDVMDHATGPELKELQAFKSGDDDPWKIKPVMRKVDSTKESPNMVPGALHRRMIGCVCEPDQTWIGWMWIQRDEPIRCKCGHWFKLYKVKAMLED